MTADDWPAANPALASSGGAVADPDSSERVPFGAYAGLSVAEVVTLDPEYARRLVASGIGSPELRAQAAALLLVRPDRHELRRGWTQGVVAAVVVVLIAAGIVGVVRAAAEESSSVQNEVPTPGPTAARKKAYGESPGQALLAGEMGLDRGADDGDRDGDDGDRDGDAGDRDGGRGGASSVAEPTGKSDGVDESQPCGKRVAGSMEAAQAERSTDQNAAVEFRVARTHDTGKVTFLNSQDPYEGRFYVAVFPDDYDAFPEPPASYFDGRCVVVQGRIELYRDTPQIVLRRATDIVVVGD